MSSPDLTQRVAPNTDLGRLSWAWVGPAVRGVIYLSVFYAIVGAYEGWAGWTYGLNSTQPEFNIYWMRVLYAEVVALPVIWLTSLGYLWITRDRDLERIPPEEELRRSFALLGMILVYVVAVFCGASYFTEQDGAWHQTVIRDTSFTPSHIILFYLSYPVYFIVGSATFMYATTRLPRFAKRISIPFTVLVSARS